MLDVIGKVLHCIADRSMCICWLFHILIWFTEYSCRVFQCLLSH